MSDKSELSGHLVHLGVQFSHLWTKTAKHKQHKYKLLSCIVQMHTINKNRLTKQCMRAMASDKILNHNSINRPPQYEQIQVHNLEHCRGGWLRSCIVHCFELESPWPSLTAKDEYWTTWQAGQIQGNIRFTLNGLSHMIILNFTSEDHARVIFFQHSSWYLASEFLIWDHTRVFFFSTFQLISGFRIHHLRAYQSHFFNIPADIWLQNSSSEQTIQLYK
jgi:hypothetical protein